MSSDVRLEDNRVSCIATDILLDEPSRRAAGGGEHHDLPRRALVHDYQDGLTLNWGKDYPGGVTINGPVQFPDAIGSVRIEDLRVREGGPDVELGVSPHDARRRKPRYVDVAEELFRLRRELDSLKDRVATLEG